MAVDWLEMMQRLAAGARAKVAEDRRRIEELQAQMADARCGVEPSASGHRAGTGDYTRDRHQWLQGLTVQELAKEFEGRQA
jgi:hypothetical protein